MRMRRKKNLDRKLADVQSVLISPVREEMDFKKDASKKEYLDYENIFENKNPVRLEIGCGKGRFAVLSALKYPDINFIAMEKSANVIYEGCALAKERGLSNIKFMNADARLIEKYFPPHSIDRIYLNFSCPYPKKAHEGRRLTNPEFLARYREILSPSGEIFQKTDNIDFFEYSLQSFKSSGFKIEYLTRNLHGEIPAEENIETEYERKFSSAGVPICALSAAPEDYGR